MLGLSISLADGVARSVRGATAPPRPTAIVIEGDSITAYTDPASYAQLWAADHGALEIHNSRSAGRSSSIYTTMPRRWRPGTRRSCRS